MWMNSMLTTMAWQTILEKNGILNQFLRLLSLPDVILINTPSAIVIGMIYNFLPYMILPLYVSLSKINRNVIAAARDLGASSWQTFTKVILPLSLPGAISGITMVFVPALTTFVISSLLGRQQDPAYRKCHRAGVHQGKQLALRFRSLAGSDDFILLSMALIAKYDKEGEGNAF